MTTGASRITPDDILHLVTTAALSVPAARLAIDRPLTAQGLDSLDVATLMVEVESAYAVNLPSDQLAHRWSVNDIVAFLNR